MKLRLRYYGDPSLRMKAEEIKEITPEIQEIARSMVDFMIAVDGIGLAATQVGIPLRIYVSNVEREEPNGEVTIGEPRVYINPVLSAPSEIMVERNEACLSLPEFYAPVKRPLTIIVDALDIEGKPFRRECYGYLARNMMHENDHLNGVLFVDRIHGKERKKIEPKLMAIKKKYYTPE